MDSRKLGLTLVVETEVAMANAALLKYHVLGLRFSRRVEDEAIDQFASLQAPLASKPCQKQLESFEEAVPGLEQGRTVGPKELAFACHVHQRTVVNPSCLPDMRVSLKPPM